MDTKPKAKRDVYGERIKRLLKQKSAIESSILQTQLNQLQTVDKALELEYRKYADKAAKKAAKEAVAKELTKQTKK